MTNEIILNGEEYMKEKSSGNIKIVILQRSWNMIGYFERNGYDCKLTNASVIRRWGTEKGLGQIAIDGKQEDTILDKCGTVRFDYLTVVAVIDCNEELWKEEL